MKYKTLEWVSQKVMGGITRSEKLEAHLIVDLATYRNDEENKQLFLGEIKKLLPSFLFFANK